MWCVWCAVCGVRVKGVCVGAPPPGRPLHKFTIVERSRFHFCFCLEWFGVIAFIFAHIYRGSTSSVSCLLMSTMVWRPCFESCLYSQLFSEIVFRSAYI